MYFHWIILFLVLTRAQCLGGFNEQGIYDPKYNNTGPVIPREVWREIKKSLKALPTNPASSVVQSVLDLPPPHDDNEEQHILLLVAVLLLAVLQLIFAVLTMPMILHFYSRRVNIGGNCYRKKKEEALV